MRIRSTSKLVLCSAIASMMFTCLGFAADQKPSGPAPEPSKEMRAKMAALHEQMAACLRSEKPVVDCRTEMMTGCQKIMGEHGCPMMGMGMHKPMMKEPPAAAPKEK